MSQPWASCRFADLSPTRTQMLEVTVLSRTRARPVSERNGGFPSLALWRRAFRMGESENRTPRWRAQRGRVWPPFRKGFYAPRPIGDDKLMTLDESDSADPGRESYLHRLLGCTRQTRW